MPLDWRALLAAFRRASSSTDDAEALAALRQAQRLADGADFVDALIAALNSERLAAIELAAFQRGYRTSAEGWPPETRH
jgi:hypothetical protein